MSVVPFPDTPFDEGGWEAIVNETISLRKKVRALELAISGDSNDLNADSVPVTQDTTNDGGLSVGAIENIFVNLSKTNPATRVYGFSVSNVAGQTVLTGATDLLTQDTVHWDSDEGFSLATSVYTVPADGIWLAMAFVNAATIDSFG